MRSVPEWHGKSDDAMPPARVKDRIRERQDNRCAITGREFRAGDTIHYDHVVPLWLGGANAEGNLQAVLAEPHKRKTAREASIKAKCDRLRQKHFNMTEKTPWNAKWKKKINGEVVPR
ncbi:HNH endonuclease [Sinorhizobium meliloti]|uniref:HNH endonuclease n=1 Tax=Rhizobium meliloti TaxID=382 RepID=UPI00398D303F